MTTLQDRLLNLRSFEITTNLSAKECADRLHRLNRPRENIFQSASLAVVLDERNSKEFYFDIRAKRRNRTWDYTTAHATGSLKENDEGKGMLSGQIKFGLYYFWGAVIVTVVALLFILNPGSNPNAACIVLIAIGVDVYVWWTLFSDRKSLLRIIEGSLIS